MKKILLSLICVSMLCAVPGLSAAQEAENQSLVNEDGIEASALELKSGESVVVYILKEDKNQLYVQNLTDSMEVVVPRSQITNIRKPTAREIRITKERLGLAAKTPQAAK